MRESRAQFIPWVCQSVVQESRALPLSQFAFLLRENLAHCLFCSFLVYYARISRIISFVDCLSVTQESRALFLLQFAYLLRQNLAHSFFFDLLVCYARVSCIVSCVNCLSVMRESRAQFIPWVCQSVVQESRALPLSQFAFLLRENLAHCFFCSFLVCYARISRNVSSVVRLSVTQESHALFPPQFSCLLRKNLAPSRFVLGPVV